MESNKSFRLLKLDNSEIWTGVFFFFLDAFIFCLKEHEQQYLSRWIYFIYLFIFIWLTLLKI